MKILVVEDDYLSSRLLKTVLSSHAEVDIVNTCKDGIDMYNTKDYDLILIDIVLLRCTGFNMVKIIRELERNGKKRARIILNSVLPLECYDSNLRSEVDFDDFYLKPAHFKDIEKLVLGGEFVG